VKSGRLRPSVAPQVPRPHASSKLACSPPSPAPWRSHLLAELLSTPDVARLPCEGGGLHLGGEPF